MPKQFEGLSKTSDNTKKRSECLGDTTKLTQLRSENGFGKYHERNSDLTMYDLQRQQQRKELRDKTIVDYDNPETPRLGGGMDREQESRGDSFDQQLFEQVWNKRM